MDIEDWNLFAIIAVPREYICIHTAARLRNFIFVIVLNRNILYTNMVLFLFHTLFLCSITTQH